MAEETNTATTEPTITGQTDPQAAQPSAQAPERDWKAEYEKAIAESRKWEGRAKENRAAAKELDELKKASMTDAEKVDAATKRAEKAEAELQALRDEAQRRVDADEVSASTGLPASLLTADLSTKAGMEAFAKQLAEWAGERQNYPAIEDRGQQTQTTKPDAMRSFGDFLAAQMR